MSALMIAGCVLFLDQILKWFLNEALSVAESIPITSFFSLSLSFNPGLSFGMFGDTLRNWPQTVAMALGLISMGLFIFAITSDSRLERAGFALMVGGALGNVLDRLRTGFVTDYLDFHFGEWSWPAFNLADIAITLGAGFVLSASLFDPLPGAIGKRTRK